MDNEKYGIELELITDKFNKQVEKVKNEAKSIQKAFDPNDMTGFTISGIKESINGYKTLNNTLKGQAGQLSEVYEKQRNSLKNLGQEAQETANKVSSVAPAKYESGDIEKAINNYAILNNQTDKAKEKQVKLKNEVKNTNKELKKTNFTSGFKSIANGLERATRKIKRFGLSLISVRSIFSLISRASSAYLGQDTELAQKLESAWIALGAVLAPIIEFIANLILKLVSVINSFIKSLTGVDLIARASSKSLKSASNSANALKKSLAGFDELQNLDQDVTGAGTGAGWANVFDNIDETWDDTFKKLYNSVDIFKENIHKKMEDSMEDAKILLRKSGFSEAFIDMYDFTARGSIKVMDGFIDSFKGILLILNGILTGNEEDVKEGFKQLIGGIWEMITGLVQTIFGAIAMLVTGIVDLLAKGCQWVYDHVIMPIENWMEEKVRKPIINTFENIKNWIYDNIIKPISNWFSDMFNGIKNTMETFNIDMKSGVIGTTINLIKGIKSYDVGTNYVPEDQLAFVHKGEAIVPKKYNTGSYSSSSSDETNYLLSQIITAINGIEINPYTTITDVGKASLSYINNKSRQLGESVVI